MHCLLPEYQACSIDETMSCIDDQPKTWGGSASEETADAGDEPTLIRGLNVEDHLLFGGSVVYDVLFRASLPAGAPETARGRTGRQAGKIGLVINVEAQDDFYPGYPLVTRAQYYCARLLATQQGVEFARSHYEQLRKVYSIWICTSPPQFRQGSVGRYRTSEEVFPPGTPGWPRSAYDLSNVIMVYLGGSDTGKRDGDDGALNLLTALFASTESADTRIRMLEEGYNIRDDPELEGEVRSMGGFAGAMINIGYQDGKADGKIEGLLSAIRSLVEKMGWSVERAMDVLEIPQKDRPTFIEKLGE